MLRKLAPRKPIFAYLSNPRLAKQNPRSNMTDLAYSVIRTLLASALCVIFSVFESNGQTVTKTYAPGFSTSVDNVGNYGYAMPSVTFSTADFSSGCLITDVNVRILWAKTDGTCGSPGTGYSYHGESSFRMDAASGTQVILATPNTWSGHVSTPLTNMWFNQGAGTPSGTPVSGTFGPNGGNLNSFNGQSPVGNWTLRVGDNAAADPLCVRAYSVQVTAGTALSSSITSQTNVACHGQSTGSLTAQGSNGTAPYSYTWSNGGTTATISGLAAGTYTVTVTDSNNCPSSTSSATIMQPASAISSTLTAVNTTCNGGSNGAVTTLTTGGTPSYTWSWSTGYVGTPLTGVAAGTYTVTITDANGCTYSNSATVSQPSALTASTSITSALDCNGDTDGQVTASPSGGTAGYSYIWNTGETNATETNLGAGTYSVTITDANGCTDSASVTLTEPTALVASVTLDSGETCPGQNDGGLTAVGSGGTTAYTYAWNTGATSVSVNVASGTYSVTITDANGCTDSASSSVPLLDTIAPTVYTQNVSVYLNAMGNYTLVPSVIDSASNDNCSIASMSIDTANFTCQNVGSPVTVTLTVTDISGLTSTGSSIVTVLDTIAPTVITQNITAYVESNGKVTISPSQINNGSYDSCGIDSIWLSDTLFNCANIGATQTITLFVRDVNNNVGSGTATINTLDTVALTVIAQNVTVYLDSFGSVFVSGAQLDNGSWDSCGIDTFYLSISAFDCGDTGANNVTLFGEDIYGNVASASAIVYVYDTIAPTIEIASTPIYLDSTGQYTLTAGIFDQGTWDSCGISNLSINVSQFDCSDVGDTVTVHFSATDVYNNTNVDSALVFILDTVAPRVITSNITIGLDSFGASSITPSMIDNGSWDSCGIASYDLDIEDFDCGMIGANTVTLTVTDVNGNTSENTAIVTVIDTIGPQVITNNVTVGLDSFGQYILTPNEVDSASWDSCGIASLSLDQTTFGCGNIGSPVTVTLTVTDVNGNSTSQTATVTTVDTIAPTIIAQNITVYLDSSGIASIDTNAINNGSEDACGIDTLYLDQSNFNCGDIGTNAVTLFAADVNSNIGSNTATVIVIDTIAPTLVLQNLTIYLDSNGAATISADTFDQGTWDSCGISSLTIDSSTFTCANHNVSININFTATDVNGNVSSATVSALILDTLAPVILANSDTVYLDTSGQYVLNYNDVNAGTYDSCGLQLMYLSDSIFDCSAVDSVNQIWFVAQDINGNIDSIQIGITVLDTIAPQMVCLDSIIVNIDTGQCGSIVSFSWPTATDNCSIDSMVQLDTTGLDSGQLFPVGITQLTYAVFDQSGNSDTCSVIIEVVDIETPILTCRSDTTICDSIFTYELPAYADNCTGLDVIQFEGIQSGDFYPVGSTINRFAISDLYGNSDTCSFEVIRDDYPSIANAGGNQDLCEDSITNITGNNPLIGVGHWNTVSGNGTISDSTSSSTVVTNLGYGITQVSWNISNGVCPISSDTIAINVFSDSASINAGVDQIICDTSSTELNAVDPQIGNYYWTTPINGATLSDTSIVNPIVTGLEIGDYTFIWNVANEVCPPGADTVLVSVKAEPVIKASDSAYIFAPSSIEISASSDIPVNYLWYNSSLTFSDSGNLITVQPAASDIYIVQGTTKFGCIRTDSVYIGVNAALEIPTAFTPDGDGFNDVWNLKELVNYPKCEVRIFNRWGHTLFESTGYETPWNGTFNGEQLPAGAYFFVIDLNVGEIDPLTGSITIIR